MDQRISGSTAIEITESVRDLRDRGMLGPGDTLPSVRALAEQLSVNRNTVVAAYRQLVQAGIAQTRGRGGTRIVDHYAAPQEGFATDNVLRDVGTGNPDPALIPDPSVALQAVVGRPVLYGEPVIDDALAHWAHGWMAADLPDRELRLTVTSGAVDAVERLLAQALTRDDAVALEDPCWLAGIQTARLGGYRTVAVPIDEQGMTVQGLRAALQAGVRAVVCTPRAQNPTGASLSAERAAALRDELSSHPYVLVIEDDHFSMLSQHPFHSILPPDHRRFALVRSVSKFLGPDMCLAVVASDPTTAERLALRLSPGTTWVSHLLQRLTHALLADADVRTAITAAGKHYAERNAAFVRRLAHDVPGLDAASGDGLNVWVTLPVTARAVGEQLMRRGWLARLGDDFVLSDAASRHLRLTVHDLDDTAAAQLADDLAAAVVTAGAKVG
ncbi:aminotransferase class I/II-fold pyridoxal phosphate-dependent enzyme [Microbacterium protaetiae]|uniref:Aminotransferase class I/II-fold pyridoxal phosphate-dependent enzyme n=1 Tax=Microbacterium protaetiae TaxID=2509458 RepID=A0A4P6EFU9_9MICO|nr:aminotransferase class I/II-fold pyridoxal phosphate-dependent enzyme [Microbacterium protaetiae]QAY61280.1 aminotransferase class I/II-fold pyridoxal phosphate-dependent enzyme [Microbacterium protaetiae]